MTPLYQAVQISKRYRGSPSLLGRLEIGRKDDSILALAGVTLQVYAGEVLGLVGESGCGKSTLGRIMVGLTEPSNGELTYRGRPLFAKGQRTDVKTALQVQMVFQEPSAALNPRIRIGDAIGEAPVAHGLVSTKARERYVCDMMEKVGLDPVTRTRFPHQFSGGQKQRIVIARALAVEPSFIVCDEAVASLDVSVQAQILNLLMDLRQTLNLALLFISHDLGVVKHIADRVAVMYLGRIVETGPARTVFTHSGHPYTRALAQETPSLGRRRWDFRPVEGEPPSPRAAPPGCAFHPRCGFAEERCKIDSPVLRPLADGHLAACHRLGEI